ncbi:hypothetical protein [Acinetobacter ursingii]|uniref:hypothetical protein n=1 Tax=Acinetobacter ursingii TaxID=108980 RepID=UPI001250106C|nr:hypothetical protein [Acinetobacter ursingii]
MSDEYIRSNLNNRFVLREATQGDDQALRNLIAVPMTTRGVLLSFQREPSYFNASDVIYNNKLHVIIEDIEKKQIVACYSNGSRPCYVNGEIQNIRYVCDLRVDQNSRGQSLVKMVGQHFKQTMHDPHFSQLIIFNDNHAARAAVQTGKSGMPDYYNEGMIETLTLTGFKKTNKLSQFLHDPHLNPHCSNLDDIQICQAEPQHVPLINQFIVEMSDYYNFIPTYDFAELLQQGPYFRGLNLSHFSLYFKKDKLVGMFGLWDQHHFKQTKILNYSRFIQLFRPIYNLYAVLTQRMPLPKKGGTFRYHLLHSLLCHPEDLTLHHKMVIDAHRLSKQRGCGVISFTLSQKDPRCSLNQFYKGEKLVGMHGFVSFEQDPRVTLGKNRVPYFEVGRI